jgi:hypothetical protein
VVPSLLLPRGSEVGGTFRTGATLSPADYRRVQYPKQPSHPVGLPLRPVKHHGKQPPNLDSSPTRRAGSSHLLVRISRASLVIASQHHHSTHSFQRLVKTTPRQTAPVHWSLNLSSPFSRAHGDVLAKHRAILSAELLHSTQTLICFKFGKRSRRRVTSRMRCYQACLCFCSCDLCRKMWAVYIV